jgi:GNAT superfamily N-acetyltransferase
MNEAVIRHARPGDGDDLAALHLDMGRHFVDLAPDDFQMPDTDGLRDFIDPNAGRDSETLWLVAEADGQVVGSVVARLHPPAETARWQVQPWASERTLHIDYLAVLESHRRKGVASRLVGATEDWGRANGAAMAITDTYLGSPLSVPFWSERQGYRRRAVILHKRLR